MNIGRLGRYTSLAALTVVAAAFALGPSLASRLGTVKPAAQRGDRTILSLSTLEGGRWMLADHRGQVVLVNFWATWCPPCRMETPDLVDTFNDFGAQGFTVVGVTMDENPRRDVPPFVRRYGIRYPIAVPTDAIAEQIDSLPTSILLDRQGRVARRYSGTVSKWALERDIKALLREPN